MTAVVVDTSVALKWVLTEDRTAEANALLAYCASNGIDLIAPVLLQHEAINVLAKKTKPPILMSVTDAQQALADILALVELRYLDLALSTRAIALAAPVQARFGFDMQFLALAEGEGCDFWTDDQDLITTLPQHPSPPVGITARWIGNFASP